MEGSQWLANPVSLVEDVIEELIDLFFSKKGHANIEEKLREDVMKFETISCANIKEGIEYLFSYEDIYVESVLYTTLVGDNRWEEYKESSDVFKEQGFNVR